ncbi:hypothetical protein LCGC14_2797160 [marine sediment metagenome]|uniref:Uncharacterized protein n=1 Tax=marine sediment metagenome TaxID=412755 RepID=A0A0F9BF77_9ZZZZ
MELIAKEKEEEKIMVSVEMLKTRIRFARGSIKGSNQRIKTILKRTKKNES